MLYPSFLTALLRRFPCFFLTSYIHLLFLLHYIRSLIYKPFLYPPFVFYGLVYRSL